MVHQCEPLVFNMRLRTLIVDDEPIARKVLREELECIDDVEIVAEADNGEKALEKIGRTQARSCAARSANACAWAAWMWCAG